MKKFILVIGLLCIFSSSTDAGTLKFDAGTRIQSHLIKVPSYAVPVMVDWWPDGNKDLLVGDEAGYVWEYRNWGSNDSPDFTPGGSKIVNVNVGRRAAPCVIDWDGQRSVDLIVGDAAGRLTLFLSNSANDKPTFDGGGYIQGIKVDGNAAPCIYDWNDDNKKDLIVGDAKGNIWVYLNGGTDGNPLFGNGYQVVGTGSGPLCVGNDAVPRVVQWDGVGNKDLVVGNKLGEIYVFLSGTKTLTGTPTFTTGTKLQTTDNKDIDVGFNSAPFVENWDGDGDIDLLVGEEDGYLSLFINSSSQIPKLLPPSKIAGAPQSLNAGSRIIPMVIDWDGDGKKDLIVGDINGYVRIYLNSGKDEEPVFTDAYTFQENPGTPKDIKVSNASPFVYDWNQDGNKDLIVGDEWGYIYLFYGSSTSPIFKPGTKTTTGTGTNTPLDVGFDAAPVICNWDNDKDMDIVAGDRYGNVTLFLNSGTDQKPIFTYPQKIKADGMDIDVGNNAKPYVIDFNGDNKKDLVIGNNAADNYGYVYVYLNIGTDENPVFTTQQPYYFQIQADSNPLKVSGYAAPVVIDWNNDNRLDLLVGEEDGYINLYTGSIENSAPVVLCNTPVGTQSNNITINYILKDEDENDRCSIQVTYSTDGGNSWATATAVRNAGDGMSNLNSSRHIFVWDSKGDLGGSFVGQVMIKIIPNDGKIEGNPNQTNNFWVNNLNPPPWEKIKLNGADLNLEAYSTPIMANWDEYPGQDLLIGSKEGYVYFSKNVGSDQSPIFDVAQKLQAKTNTTWGVLDVGENSSPFVSNWDRTGGKELIVGDGLGYVWWFKNDSQNQTPELNQGEKIKVGADNIKVTGGKAVPVVADWNSDGYDDLIVGDGNGNVYLYLNDKTSDTVPKLLPGVKIQANSDLDVGLNATPYVVDWDGDYKNDLIIGNSDGNVFWYKNIGTNGTATFNSGTKIKFLDEEIKVDANSRPAVLKQEGKNIDLIIGSNAGYVFLYHLTDVVQNTPPQLAVINPQGTQTTQTGSVTITYTLRDDQWNTCNLKVEYSWDGQNWYSATGTPKTGTSSPTGVENTFTWFSDKDVPATLSYVYLRLIPNDKTVDGQTATVSFYLRNKNNLPVASNVLGTPTGKFGQIEISYNLADADGDLCNILVEYQGGKVGGKWATATVTGTITNVSPGTRKLTWLSAIDEKNQKATYTIRITPKDIGGYGTAAMSMIFTLDNTVLSTQLVKAGETPELIFSPTKIKIVNAYNEDVLITVEQNPQGVPGMNTLASLSNTVRRINAVKLANTNQSAPPTKAKITIDYTDLNSYDTEILLRIFELRENKWILVEGNQSVDVVNNSVTAEVEYFSVFRIGLYAPTLANFSVWPNPFKDNDGIKENGEISKGVPYAVMTFQGVTKVQIYTIAGELVRESRDNEISSGGWPWDLKNDYGRLVGSGIYIYVVKDSTGASLVGRVGVIR